MRSVLILAALAIAALAPSAFAQTETAPASPAPCVRPERPPAVDGATATLEQIKTAKNEAAGFIAASDTYQSCVLDELAAKRAAAKAAKTKLDPAIAKEADAKVAANQEDKVAVGGAYNSAARAYKEAHP